MTTTPPKETPTGGQDLAGDTKQQTAAIVIDGKMLVTTKAKAALLALSAATLIGGGT